MQKHIPTARRHFPLNALALAVLALSTNVSPAWAQDDLSFDDLFGDTSSSETASASSDNNADSGNDNSTATEQPADTDGASETAATEDSAAGEETATTAPVETIPVEPLQTAEAPEDTVTPPPAKRQIEEIVVTATKREASVRDIPVSIDAMSGDDLTEAGATDLEQILAQSPGVTFASTGGSEIRQQVIIRGITASGTAGYGGTTTGYLFNDVSLVNPSVAGAIPTIDPYDLATVEVLKGPQGTLFGGAALAGAIRYVPKKPVFGESSGGFAAGVSTLAESDDLGREYTGHLNVPVGETAAVRVVGVRREIAGVVDDLYNEEKDIDSGTNTQARIIGAWDVTDRFNVEMMAYRFEAKSDSSGATDNPDRRETESRRVETPGDTWANIYRGQLEYGFDNFSVTGIGSYIEKNNNSIFDLTAYWGLENVPGTTIYQEYYGHSKQKTAELRVVSSEPSDLGFAPLNDWQYLAGVYWLDADQIFNNSTLGDILAIIPLDIPSDVSATAEETAFFFDLTRPLGDHFELNLAGRYFEQSSTGYLGDSAPDGVDLKEDGFNPKAALTWHASENIRVIASYAKGFRFGGFNNNPLNDPDIEFTYYSDEIRNYEFGLRTDWLDGALRIDVTGFYIDWINPQVRQSSQQTSTSYIANASGARIQGVETAITSLLPGNFMLTLNASYLDSKLTEEYATSRGTAPAGSRLPATPFLTGSVGLMNELTMGDWVLNSGINYSYQSETNNEVVDYERLPAFSLLGASLNFSRPGSMTPSIRISGTNLLNETAAVNAFQGLESLNGTTSYGIIRPRTITVSLGVNF